MSRVVLLNSIKIGKIKVNPDRKVCEKEAKTRSLWLSVRPKTSGLAEVPLYRNSAERGLLRNRKLRGVGE